MDYRKPLSIVMFAILAASSFTFLGAFTFFPMQEAEAQGLTLRVSPAENPAFENHFFGGQIVQVIIDDPGATDPDESTVGLVILGANTPRVHLTDGLWYAFIAEDQGFSILLDILTDGARNQRIAVSKAANDAGSPVTIGGVSFTIDLAAPDSFVAELEAHLGFTYAQLNDGDFFTILPQPFFEGGTNVNPDLSIGVDDEGVADADGEFCEAVEGGLPTGAGAEGDPDCDWPWIKMVGIEELGTMEVRAGTTASVVLVFDDLADSITSALDRATDYPLNAELIIAFTDFMWNINPVEEDSVFFALDRTTGKPSNILYQPVALFDPDGAGGTADNFPDLINAFTSSPGLEFDERQIMELDTEGINVISYTNVFDASRGVVGTFVSDLPTPFTREAANARTLAQFAGATIFFDSNDDGDDADAGDQEAVVAADLPVIPMFEGDPNVSVFDNTVELAGGRATLFTAVNDRVASFDYFDIINSAPMTTHDGFTSVDREVYDSADRAVFTVTDSDQNLRSRISEEPSGRESSSFIKVGNPFPLVNTRAAANQISNTSIDTITRLWGATDLRSGTGGVGVLPDATTFGIDGGPGANIFADVDNNGIIDMGFLAGQGTERFHVDGTAAGGPDIAEIVSGTAAFPETNRQQAIVFTPANIGGSRISTIIVDTTLTVDNIDDFLDVQDITGNEILGQVRVDELFDKFGTATAPDQLENFLVQVAEIREQDGDILGRSAGPANVGIVGATSYDVRMPRYNLVHVDLTDLSTLFNFGEAVVKIDAIDSTCISATVATAFAVTCVHASQVVDFQIVEPVGLVNGDDESRDTDARANTGDQFISAVKDVTDAVVAEGGIDVWSSEIADVIETVGADRETGFDRDPLSSRVGTGAFRPLDLAAVADCNDDGNCTNNSHLTDRIRVTLMMLSSGDAASVAAGFALDEPIETINNVSQRVVIDIGGLGTIFDPAPTDSTPDDIQSPIGHAFANLMYRLELDEEGSNSSIFTGRADFLTFLQHDTVSDILSEITLTGDPLRVWLPNRFIPPNRLAFAHVDEDIVQFFREVSATFIYETRDGSVEWDRSSFSFGQDAFLTITDEDLNRRPDATERYNLPVDSFIFFELGKTRVCPDTIDIDPLAGDVDAPSDCPADAFATAAFTNQIDATLLETGPNTGTYVAQITMPTTIRVDSTPGTANTADVPVQQQDIEANYIDIRDSSSVRQEFDDITNIRTTLGDVVLDRAAYPPGAIMYVEIHDNDFNTDVDIRETINLLTLVATTNITTGNLRTATGADIIEGTRITQVADGGDADAIFDLNVGGTAVTSVAATFAGTVSAAGADGAFEAAFAPAGSLAPIVEITVFREGTGRAFTMLPVGFFGPTLTNCVTGNADDNNRLGSGITTNTAIAGPATSSTCRVLPILDRNANAISTAVETGPNTGIFEFEVRLPGPPLNANAFPITLPAVIRSTGTVTDTVSTTAPLNRIDANLPIQVTYFDPADESGASEDEEELATFLFNTARLRTDKLEYGLGEPVDVIVEEPDFNLDSREVDDIPFSILEIITDKVDTEDNAATDFGTVIRGTNNLRTNLTVFRESGFNTGVLVVQIEELIEALVDRGEDVELIYRDQTPSGGGTSIRIEYEFLVVEILPEIIFDKEEYTPFDEIIVSIISPDSNQDPDRIEIIRPIVSSSSASLGQQRFPETGPNTGIFEEDFDLTPNATNFPGDLTAIREDGVTVEFRIDEDTVATKSVFVNYHVGQVMFDKDAFRISERGVLRVIDPDANTHPDTIDTIGGSDLRFWSTTDRGGLAVTLRETGDRTGIFEEIISFTPDEESTGTRLRVSEGDTITAKYTDKTLPAPAALATDQIFTVEVEELFASALIGAIVPPLERAVASEAELVDQTGAVLTDVSVGSQVLIQSEITNSQTKKQPFAYIVQIKDENGVTISLSWVTGELPAKESLKAAQSWIPDAAGDFTVEIFVWESVDSPVALSPVRTSTVSVS